MKKILCLVIVAMLMLFCVGCSSVESTEIDSENSVFVRIEKVWVDGYFFNIIYHKATKVMYTVSHRGTLTVMLDADGKPLLWEG